MAPPPAPSRPWHDVLFPVNCDAENDAFRSEISSILRDRWILVMLASLITAGYLVLKIELPDAFTFDVSVAFLAMVPGLWLAAYLMDTLYARFHHDAGTIARRHTALERGEASVRQKCRDYEVCRSTIWKGFLRSAMDKILAA